MTRTPITTSYTARTQIWTNTMSIIQTAFWVDAEVWEDTKIWRDEWWNGLNYSARTPITTTYS